ncbi:MAG: DUF4199 domain-containing protein [Muribaculaceae bacterium]|nr:DUF4199 domain-containing protein [Muribaculaceae bacterium]
MKSDDEIRRMSVYRRGARDGAWMGLVLCGLFASWALSMRSPLASVAFMVLALAVPVLACMQLRRSFRIDMGMSTLSALWMQGICTFFFGTLLMAALALVWLRWWQPGLIQDSLLQAADVYAGIDNPDARRMAADVHTLIDKGLVPRPVDVALSLLWGGVFSGSILSLVCGAVLRATGAKK